MAGQHVALVDVDPHAPGEPEVTIPVFKRLCAPQGLATKRPLRARGLRPGGQGPVAEVEARGPRNGLLYEIAKARPVRSMTLAKEYALDKAMAAGRPAAPAGSATNSYSRPPSPAAWSATTAPQPTPPPTPWPRSPTSWPPERTPAPPEIPGERGKTEVER